MKYTVFALIVLVILLIEGILLSHQPQVVVKRASGCTNIPASPDYLSSGKEEDAIVAINNARSLEHLHPLYLPAGFFDADPIQQQFILVNLERTDRGLRPLLLDKNLSLMAQAYSKQMLDLHFFSHTSPIGGTFSERMQANPSLANHFVEAAENLAGNPVPGAGAIYEYMYDDAAEQCGHRQNILNPDLTFIGVGWLPGSKYDSLSVQEFISSAPWNPYAGDVVTFALPQVRLQVWKNQSTKTLRCLTVTEGNAEPVRITWFLDQVGGSSQTGANWTLELAHLARGKHVLLVYAVDGGQHYSLVKYAFQV